MSNKILLIGDMIMDRSVYGDVRRISPEAPIPIFNIISEEYNLGGVGNVFNNLANIGHKDSIGMIIEINKNDNSDKIIRNFINQEYIRDFVCFFRNKINTLKTRYISDKHKQQVLRTDLEDCTYNDWSEDEKNTIRNTVKDYQIVILSDYCKGFLSENNIRFIIDLCKINNIRIIIDSKKDNPDIFENAYMLKINENELSNLSKKNIENENDIINSVKIFNKIEYILITRGENGMMLFDKNHNLVIKLKPYKIKEVHDVTGAGDTVISVLAFYIANKYDIIESVSLANMAGGVVVGKHGCVPINDEEFSMIKDDYKFISINSDKTPS